MATSSADRAAARQDRWATVQGAALVVGAVFVLVGILGFIPGATDYGSGMKAAGHASGAMLLHLFQVSILHNIVYLLFGVAGLLMARTINGARTFLVDGGIIYLVLWVYGLLIKSDSAENFLRSTPRTTGCISLWVPAWFCCGHGAPQTPPRC